MGHLQQSAKNRDRFRANIVEYGKNNKITGQAELEQFQLQIGSPLLIITDIAAIITNQYYLAQIDNKLSSIDKKLEHIEKFLEESKKSDLWANGQFIKEVSNRIYEILRDDQYRLATLTSVQGIRTKVMGCVNFYHTMMSKYVEKNFNNKIKDFTETKNMISNFYDYFDAYCYSVYVYEIAYFIEVLLSQLTDEKNFLDVKENIEDVIDDFKYDYTCEVEQFIDSVKSINPNWVTKWLSKLALGRFQSYSLKSPIAGMAALITKLSGAIAKGNEEKKKAYKEEIEKIYITRQERIEISIKELDLTLSTIDRMNDLYNGPVELMIGKDSAYLKLKRA